MTPHTAHAPYQPAVPPTSTLARSTPWHLGSQWWDAKTVLVTRPVGPGQIAITPHLVVPAPHDQLAFLLSSYSEEAQQLAYDGRVVIQTGDWRGRPALGTRQHYGLARIISDTNISAQVQDHMRVKYGARTAFARMAHRLANGAVPYGDLVAVVELRPNPPFMLTP
ncbi:hypothetical protein JK358_22040 [Nocardia sp. 2]|uniref:Pyridoxamine 5'-phosphate oxidase putative domain-containing protein n=1 Tax=Nocardia acididurans TaxID=2802282 RepID=A0ABS1M8W1_9NOCA|nr:hypothetical protein [Nocardia acididurans]MBL1077083.1 hypothetical protein [Nocardia acididurans]